MRLNYPALVALILAFNSPFLVAAPVTIYVNNDQEPKAWFDEASKSAKGFAVEMTEAIFRDAGIDYVIEAVPFPRGIYLAKTCKGLMAGVFKTDERRELFSFSQPIVPDNFVVVTRSDAPLDYRTLDDLNGRAISYLRGSAVEARLQKQFPADKLIALNDPAAMIKMLAANHTQAAILNPGPVSVVVAARNAGVPMEKLSVSQTPLSTMQNHLIACKDDATLNALLKRADTSIRNLNAKGAFEKIMRAYGEI